MTNSGLAENGYQVVERILGTEFRERLREDCAARANAHTDKYTNGVANTLAVDVNNQSHIALMQHGELILRMLKISPVKYLAGAIIPKYKDEGRRQWHVDWWDWDDPITRLPDAPQIGIIFYLDDTKDSGSFIALPGSHLGPGDVPEINTFEPHDREITVDVNAGDAVVFDARMLHAVSPNTVKDLRIAMTLWYLPKWESLPEGIKATAMLCHDPNSRTKLGKLAPDYEGNATPRPCITVPKWG